MTSTIQRADLRTLCYHCKSNYEHSGYMVKKLTWQEYKDDCDICHVRMGWEYEVSAAQLPGSLGDGGG